MADNEQLIKIRADVQQVLTELKKLEGQFKKLGATMDNTAQRSVSSSKKVKGSLDELESKYRLLRAELQRLESKEKRGMLVNRQEIETYKLIKAQLRDLAVKHRELTSAKQKSTAATKQQTAATKQFGTQISLTRQLMLRLRSVMLTVFGAYAVINGIRNTVNLLKDFELAMARVQAISGATDKELKQLAETAINLSSKGIFKAKDIADVELTLSKLGFTVNEISSSLGSIVNLATATGEDLNTAAELVASTIRGMGIDVLETTRVVDVMGKAFTTSALDVSRFRESIKYIAPLARQVGWTIEDVAVGLGKLADAQIYGSLAGTGFRNIMIEIADSSSKFSQGVGRTVKGFDDFILALEELNAKGLDLTKILELFPKRSSTAVAALAAYPQALREYKEVIDEASGSIDKMSGEVLDTFDSALKNVKTSWDALILGMRSDDGFLKKSMQGLAVLLDMISGRFTDANILAQEMAETWRNALLENIDNEQRFNMVYDEARKIHQANIDKLEKQLELEKDLEEIIARGGTKQGLADRKKELAEVEEIISVLTPEIREMGNMLYEFETQILIRELNKELERTFENIKSNGVPAIDALDRAYNTLNNELIATGDNLKTQIQDIPVTDTTGKREALLKDLTRVSKEMESLFKTYNIMMQDLINKRDELIEKNKELFEQFLKDEKKRLAMLHNLRLSYIELMDDGREKELAIAEENYKAKKEMDELTLKSGALTAKQTEILQEQMEVDAELHRKELDDINRKWDENDFKEAEKAMKDRVKLQKTINETEIQEMENLGVSKDNIQKKQIAQEIELIQEQIEFYEDYADSIEDAEKAIAALRAELDRLNAALKGVGGTDEEGKGKSLIESIFGSTKKFNQFKRMADEMIGLLQGIADAAVESNQRIIDDLNTRIAEEQRALDQEIQLMTEGYANNVDAKRKEVEELQRLRDESLRDQEQAVKRQKALETLSQTLSLLTAVAQIFKAESSKGKVGIALAIGAIAVMMAAFAATKTEVSKATKYAKGGKLKGRSHSQGGIPVPELNAELEGDEYVINKKSTSKHERLLDAINRDDKIAINKEILANISKNERAVIVNPQINAKQWDNIERFLRQTVGGKVIERGDKYRVERRGNHTRKINLN